MNMVSNIHNIFFCMLEYYVIFCDIDILFSKFSIKTPSKRNMHCCFNGRYTRCSHGY